MGRWTLPGKLCWWLSDGRGEGSPAAGDCALRQRGAGVPPNEIKHSSEARRPHRSHGTTYSGEAFLSAKTSHPCGCRPLWERGEGLPPSRVLPFLSLEGKGKIPWREGKVENFGGRSKRQAALDLPVAFPQSNLASIVLPKSTPEQQSANQERPRRSERLACIPPSVSAASGRAAIPARACAPWRKPPAAQTGLRSAELSAPCSFPKDSSPYLASKWTRSSPGAWRRVQTSTTQLGESMFENTKGFPPFSNVLITAFSSHKVTSKLMYRNTG